LKPLPAVPVQMLRKELPQWEDSHRRGRINTLTRKNNYKKLK